MRRLSPRERRFTRISVRDVTVLTGKGSINCVSDGWMSAFPRFHMIERAVRGIILVPVCPLS